MVESTDMMPKRKTQRAWQAFIVGLAIVSPALFLVSGNGSALSPLESRLVGEWSSNPLDNFTRTYSPDRTFSTSNEQFVGNWRINDGKLTVTYWQDFKLPRSISRASFELSFESLRRSRKKTICSWQIQFSDDSHQHSLSHPVDELHPDGKWLWTRVPER